MFPTLALMVLLPVVGAIIVGLVPKRRSELVYPISVAVSFLPLAATTIPPEWIPR